MASDNNLLIVEMLRLQKRIETLEAAAFGQGNMYVEGWPNAARIVGVSGATARKRALAGDWPKPCRTEPFERSDGQIFSKPVWRRRDLEAYAEGA